MAPGCPPAAPKTLDVINPATEAVAGRISMGGAGRREPRGRRREEAPFATFSRTSRAERLDLLNRIIAVYEKRMPEMAQAITEEMGAPIWLSKSAQAMIGLVHLKTAARRAFDLPNSSTCAAPPAS